MSRNLFLITTGPVQSYISQARKTQDLYAGSYILSHLTDVAAQKILNLGGEIIFPFFDPARPGSSLPNRVLAIFNTAPDEELEKTGLAIETAIRNKFTFMGDTIWQKVTEIIGPQTKPPTFQQQLKKHLEIYWVFQPLTREDDYLPAYNKIIANLGAVKNIRQFQPLAEQGRKCSIGGEHNVVFHHLNQTVPASICVKGLGPRYIKKDEALGAVNFIKRCANLYFNDQTDRQFVPNFPSTSAIAFLATKTKLKTAMNEQEMVLSAHSFDWAKINEKVIYELHNNNGRLPTNFEDEEVQQLPQSAAPPNYLPEKTLYEFLKKHELPLSPYYAVLRFDGDNMGSWYGKPPELAQGTSPMQFHQDLSRQLQAFAEQAVKKIITPDKGHIVYAGGEDFLGFINLSSLLEVMVDLRTAFGAIDLTSYTEQKLTFSAGAAIAHYKMPLREVLKWSSLMEQQAKTTFMEKDAFSLAVLKHSGEISHTTYKWRLNSEWTPHLFQKIIQGIHQQDFSAAFIRHLNQSLTHLVAEVDSCLTPTRSNAGFPKNAAIVNAEIKRTAKRACLLTRRPNEGKDDFLKRKEQAIQTLVEQLKSLSDSHLLSSTGTADFLAGLNIIAFLERMTEPWPLQLKR